jgi:hypothetical protein
MFPFTRKFAPQIGNAIPPPEWFTESAAQVHQETHELSLDTHFLPVGFTTIFEYLFFLREVTTALQPAGPSAMLYLAAAVSGKQEQPRSQL